MLATADAFRKEPISNAGTLEAIQVQAAPLIEHTAYFLPLLVRMVQCFCSLFYFKMFVTRHRRWRRHDSINELCLYRFGKNANSPSQHRHPHCSKYWCAFGSAVLATIVASHLDIANPDFSHLASAYPSGFLTASTLMVVMIIPALFLTNKISSKVASRQ